VIDLTAERRAEGLQISKIVSKNDIVKDTICKWGDRTYWVWHPKPYLDCHRLITWWFCSLSCL